MEVHWCGNGGWSGGAFLWADGGISNSYAYSRENLSLMEWAVMWLHNS